MSFLTRLRWLGPRSTTERACADAATEATDEKANERGHTVAGERGIASINGTRSLQSRVTAVLAAGVMSVLAIGFLGWYYTQTFSRRPGSDATGPSRMRNQPQSEMALPPLGPPIIEQVLGPPPPLPAASAPRSYDAQMQSASSNYAEATSTTHGPATIDRRLSGPVVAMASESSAATGHRDQRTVAAVEDTTLMRSNVGTEAASDFQDLLVPTSTPAAQAEVLPTQRLLLPKGASLDCTLESAIDSSLPGMTTCITSTDTFGADGNVVLLERGSKLVGETRGDVRQGSTRLYVLWTQARTPTGVVVPLASPGTDEIGRAGLPGEVDRHFWERFGSALLVSVIDGVVQAAAQRSSSGNDGVIVNPSTSSNVMTEVLRSTINIPPTLKKQHGDRIAVLVARDLDFRSVYELRPAQDR